MSRKFFGTDGIRGRFNQELDVKLAVKVGIAASKVFKPGAHVCIGMDTRASSKALENALVSGFISGGTNVSLLGYITTPVISKTIIDSDVFEAGVMISASHNPFHDNGIKFFGKDGKKLSDELELLIEENILHDLSLIGKDIGKIYTDFEAKSRYIDYLVANGINLSGLNIGLDCANGGSYQIAPIVFEKLGANIFVIGDTPDGININKDVGSTHPEKIANLVVEKKLDFAFGFDGDGDRIVLINSDGEVLDGDYILFALTKLLLSEGKLKNKQCVGTVMANLGFKNALLELGVEFLETAVGDRFVMQEMTKSSACLGGEQSGHIIMSDLLPTGDGILTAVILSKLFATDMNSLKNIKKDLVKYPQVLKNIKVDDKVLVLENPQMNALIDEYDRVLGDQGRILVRASGTEQLIRVMVEAKESVQCEQICDKIIMVMKKI